MRVFWWVTGAYVFASIIPFQDVYPIATRRFSSFTSTVTGSYVAGPGYSSLAAVPYDYRRGPYAYRNYVGAGGNGYRNYILTGQYDYINSDESYDFHSRPFDCSQDWQGPSPVSDGRC